MHIYIFIYLVYKYFKTQKSMKFSFKIYHFKLKPKKGDKIREIKALIAPKNAERQGKEKTLKVAQRNSF